MSDDFKYEEFSNLDQHAYLEVLATRKESERFQAQTALELAVATGDSTADRQSVVDKLTTEINTLREKLEALPPLSDEEKSDIVVLKKNIRVQPQRPDRPGGPPR